jgi:uncharacterized protein YacL
MLASKKSKNFVEFNNVLTPQQRETYKKITQERMNIYIQGLVIGSVLAVLMSQMVKLDKNKKVCLFVVIALGFNYAYYTLYPKSTYMLQHLTSKEQNQAWLNIYKEMKTRCMVGLLLGLAGYIILGMGTCK